MGFYLITIIRAVAEIVSNAPIPLWPIVQSIIIEKVGIYKEKVGNP